MGTAVAGVVLVGLSLSGASLRLRQIADTLTEWSGGLNAALSVVVLTLMVVVILQLIEFPFVFYQGHLLEHHYGLSTQSTKRWLLDHGKGLLLGTVFAVAGTSIVFLMLRRWPQQWWWMSAGIFAIAMIGLAQLAPVLLMPIFYKFKPLDRPLLVERLMGLATRARTDIVGVFEWVLSDHTKKANAALAGMGKTRRILLSDTLLTDYSEDEIEVILAHELAHHVHRDLWRGIALQAVILAGGFYVSNLILRAAVGPLALSGVSDPAALPALMLVGGVWSFLAMPLANALSRAQERAADRYALTTTRNVDAFVTAMKRLSQQNLAEEYPSQLVRLLFYSHPPIRERIDAARAFGRGENHAA